MSSAEPPSSTLKLGLKNQNFTQKFLQIALSTEKIQTCSFHVFQGVLHPKMQRRPIRGYIRGFKNLRSLKNVVFPLFWPFFEHNARGKVKISKIPFVVVSAMSMRTEIALGKGVEN
jgi:hypothetical protein